MNKVTLITSEGCLGCEVMKTSIKTAIEKTKANVKVEEMDISKVNNNFINNMNRNTINYILIVIVTILSTKFALEKKIAPP